MEMTGSRSIAADRATVWAHLTDVETLRACIPGCEELTGSIDDGFSAVIKQKIGPVRATFRGTVSLTDVVVGESYRISGEGSGGVAGFAKGAADVRLHEADGLTELTYEVQAQMGGKIAQLGARLINGFSRKMAAEFFDRFQARVEGTDAGADGISEPSPDDQPR